MQSELFFTAAYSALATLLICLSARRLATRLGLVDTPEGRKRHRRPTPLAGGVALVAAFVPAVAVAAYFSGPDSLLFERGPALALATFAMVVVGLADDRHSLSATARLVISFSLFAGAAIIFPEYRLRLLNFEHPFFEIGLVTTPSGIFFTSLCLVGLINAVNMADGKNGLVIGLGLGWCLMLYSRAPNWTNAPLISLIATLSVLLAFNLRGRLFLGDGGAYGLAAAVGMLAIAVYNSPGNHTFRAVSAEELMILFAVPVADSFRLTLVRWRRGQSPMAADRDHLHHHLESRFGWPRGLAIYWLVALLPSAVLFAFA